MSDLAAEIGASLGARIGRLCAVSGGSICNAFAAEVEGTGERIFVKALADAPSGLFAAEAAGLAWLAEPAALRIPEVLAAGATWIALRWIAPGRLDDAGEETLGRGLAALHAAGARAHGAAPPGAPEIVHLGPLALPARPRPTWALAYAEDRLRPLLALASDRGALTAVASRAVERVCDRIESLAGPPEPPARLHGDLWSGNVLAGADGRPHLIDPGAHGGHRETDLAMLRLFGGPSERCFAAYAEAAPLSAGHEEREALWQLQPLLVHAILFGGGYGERAGRIANRYA